MIRMMQLCTLMCVAGAAAQEIGSFESLGQPTEYFESVGGYRLAVRRWNAAASFRATVVFQHGGGWHSGYHGYVFGELANEGYEVVAMDSMGHGFSEGPGGKTNWDSLTSVREDLRRLCAAQRQPIVLVVESMGSVIGTPLAFSPSAVDALVVSGGLFKLYPATAPPKPVQALLKFVGRFMPNKRIRLPSMNTTFDSAFGDERWAQAARADPNIVVDAFYLGPMTQVLREAPKILANASAISIPCLVMHSEVDTRTDVAAARAFYDKLVSTDKKLEVYSDASHQLFQDSPAKTARATADLRAWLDARYHPAVTETNSCANDECLESTEED